MLNGKPFPRLIVANVLAGLGMWIVAGVWHNLLLPKLDESTHAHDQGMVILLIAYFILALFMTYLYQQMYFANQSWVSGLKVGALVGVLWVFPHDLVIAGIHGDSLVGVFKNGVWHIVEQGVGGVIIAAVYLFRPRG